MNKTDVNGNGNHEPPPQPEFVPECGTPTTPPCPLQAFYAERRKTIEQLAGPHANRRRIEQVAHEVDRYLITSLHGVSVLVRSTLEHDRSHAGYDHEPHAPQSSAPK